MMRIGVCTLFLAQVAVSSNLLRVEYEKDDSKTLETITVDGSERNSEYIEIDLGSCSVRFWGSAREELKRVSNNKKISIPNPIYQWPNVAEESGDENDVFEKQVWVSQLRPLRLTVYCKTKATEEDLGSIIGGLTADDRMGLSKLWSQNLETGQLSLGERGDPMIDFSKVGGEGEKICRKLLRIKNLLLEEIAKAPTDSSLNIFDYLGNEYTSLVGWITGNTKPQ